MSKVATKLVLIHFIKICWNSYYVSGTVLLLTTQCDPQIRQYACLLESYSLLLERC